MRLAVKFSPPQNSVGGSQHTYALNLIGALHQCHRDLVVYSDYPALSGVNGLEVHRGGCSLRPGPLGQMLFAWLREQFCFERRLLAERCDALFCPFNHEALLKTWRVPQVVTVHDLIPLIYPAFFPKTSRLWKCVYGPAIWNARAVVTVSEHTRADLLRLFRLPEGKVHVVPNGYQPVATFAYREPERRLGDYMLYVSSSHYPYKNILGLVRAFARLRGKHPHKLVVVGQAVPRFSAEVTGLRQQLGLENSVLLLSNVSSAELGALYQGAAVFVYPSLYEGFGMPPLEAMSCGVPVVASNRTSIPEVCGEAAYYVDPTDERALAEAVSEVLTNQPVRQKLIAAGHERAKRFTWQACAERILQVCRAALSP